MGASGPAPVQPVIPYEDWLVMEQSYRVIIVTKETKYSEPERVWRSSIRPFGQALRFIRRSVREEVTA